MASALLDSLLVKHAPIVRFDERERFSPIAIDRYVQNCQLFVDSSILTDRPQVDHLDDSLGPNASLRFVRDDERCEVKARDVRRLATKLLEGRLGHVGLFGRIVDALFRLALLLRPTVPKRTTTAAELKVDRHDIDTGSTCYARAIHQGEWLVLHYAYFYAMNDWRSTYWGLNDHEADWEQAWVYLDPDDYRPVWVAATSHDHSGSDLRRHWDDPAIEIIDDKPVLFAAAGSHAFFMEAGNYVTRIDIPWLRWTQQLRHYLATSLLRKRPLGTVHGLGPQFGLPFVDAATGDGDEISQWKIQPMSGPWCDGYRGLWGLDTHDPLQGERGPSGPKFDRDGEIRKSWADPLGFAGLHGALPPSAAAARVNITKIDHAVEDLDAEIKSIGRLLPLAHLTKSPVEMDTVGLRLTELLRQRCELIDLRSRLASGEPVSEGLRSHLVRPARPLARVRRRRTIVRDGWAVVSVPAFVSLLAWFVIGGGVPGISVDTVLSASELTRFLIGGLLALFATAILFVNLREVIFSLRASGSVSGRSIGGFTDRR